VYTGRQQEGHQASRNVGEAKRADGAVVNVPQQEVMDRSIPIASKLVPGDRVPPVSVESPIGEPGDLGHSIELQDC
jgi:hypothetical protein